MSAYVNTLTSKTLAFLRGAPAGPPHPPPVAAAELAVELELGARLPGLLRRVYAEIADGGFGPA